MTTKHDAYVHGYSTASTVMASRSAETFAAFFLPHLESGTDLLDVGCGPGAITIGLARHVEPGKVTGVDIGESDVKKAVQLAHKEDVENATFIVADATALPLEDSTFDALFSCAMLEHIPDCAAAVAEMKRVLKPGGKIGLVGGSPSRFIAIPDQPYIHRAREIYVKVWESRGGHPEMGTEQIELLWDAGFTDLEVSAAFESRPTTDDYAHRLTAEAFVESAEAEGASTRAELESLAEQIRATAATGTAITMVPWVSVVATRPGVNA